MNGFLRVFVRLPDWIKERWWRVAYLAPPDPIRERFAELLETAPDKRFNKLVADSIEALVERGELPAKEIAPTIVNMADDVMAGKPITIRAGDYIALQGFLRKKGGF
jgi:hypothetical protein